ncbi:uncharacterized protein Z518_03568 [Rhinocladiella mackenziei CBS 650.93]|uniref:NAD(P)-binding domain-containing protein n=1 Tax=Rhinocladiella mackenziei CBS 650.93 TaxID=1442369 RepID=A0A0D2IZT4_9EURO|nr:uncharacterized protein Z518_03568 [Rhinocladiella mackenziei CBS 650.93]KIX08911.1 hypothetical protein Z518_03568 [Rhinocladiella mackenziei CBS 650.93]
MAASKVLVIGGTGPAGICLLRELLYRTHATVVYARNPSKIPEDLLSNTLLEVVKGELTDTDALSTAVSKCRIIVSLLGPNDLFNIQPTIYVDFYSSLFTLMRQHGVRRIFAMGTLSIPNSNDTFSLTRALTVLLVRIIVNRGYQTALAIGRVFKERADGLDWTVFRIAGIPGGSDEASWRSDREDGDTFEGWIGQQGWSSFQKRGALARWLVDAVEDGKAQWIGKMPAVSRLAGSQRKDA